MDDPSAPAPGGQVSAKALLPFKGGQRVHEQAQSVLPELQGEDEWGAIRTRPSAGGPAGQAILLCRAAPSNCVSLRALQAEEWSGTSWSR